MTTADDGEGAARGEDVILDRLSDFSFLDEPAEADILPADRTQAIPASNAQLGIWFFENAANEGTPAYHIPTLVRLIGRVDEQILEQAVNIVVGRYEILRCGVVERGGEVLLRPLPMRAIRLAVEVLAEQQVAGAVAERTAMPFDLSEGPLVRWSLFRVSDTDRRLLMLQHHIISDGWSVGLLTRELLDTYEGLERGDHTILSAPALQYADYAAFSRSAAKQEAAAGAIGYWTEKLRDVPLLELPCDRPRPSDPSRNGRHHHFRLSAHLVSKLRSFARERRVTPYAVLFSAHALLLARYSGQRDFVVTMPVDGRALPELTTMLGCFINLLPVRCRVDPADGFAAHVGWTFDALLEGATFQDAPFHRIVAGLRNAAATPDTVLEKLFRSLFVLDSFNRDSGFAGSEFSAEITVEADYNVAKTDLSFGMQEMGEEIAVRIEYAIELFDADTIARMASHFTRILTSALAEPERPVGTLPLLSPDEFRALVVSANRTETAFPRQRSLTDLFEDAARRFADNPAYVDGDESVDYATLDRRAGQFMAALLDAGLEPGGRVGILLDRGLDALIAILGIIKAGGLYVPVDPTYPRERISLILEDADIRIVVLATGQPASVDVGERTMLSVSPDSGAVTRVAPHRPRQADDIAYICYTSGTTGRPRGVIIKDRAVNRLVFETNYLDYRPELRIGFASNLVFDGATLEIWGALLHGGCLVQVPRATLLEVDMLAQLLRAQHIDVIILTAPLFHRFAEERPGAFGGMEAVLTGGAVVNPGAVARVLGSVTPPASVLNCYGPTETTTFAATHPMRPGDVIDLSRSLPIGRAIANTRLYVVDPRDEPVPVGIPGELLIGGDGVAEGYLNRPEQNRDKFVAMVLSHPDEPDQSIRDRVYRSGDVVKWRSDGLLEFVGRADRQIKLRGFRVELGEIEAAILTHPAISDAIVIPHAIDSDWRLDAYYSGEAAPSAEALNAYLGRRLPAYMIPHRLRALAGMPLNVSGKIDVAALPASAEPMTVAPAVACDSGSLVRNELAGIVAEVLACAPPGPDDDFFALGGDSIQSIRVAGRARDRGFALTVRDIFEHRTIARISAVLEQRTPSLDASRSGSDGAELALTPIQKWFFDFDFKVPGHINLAILLKARVRIDRGRMQRAVNRLVARQEALRSRWPRDPATRSHRHFVLPAGDVADIHVPTYQLVETNGAAAAEVERTCTGWQEGFDFETGPILCAGIIENHPDGCDRLFIAVHHLAIDIVSWWILLDQLRNLYEEDGASLPPGETGSLRRWSQALTEQANSASTLRELPYWVEATSGPAHFTSLRESAEEIRLDRRQSVRAELFDEVASAGEALLGLRAHEVMIAVATLALAGEIGQRDVTVAIEGHGRESPALRGDLSRTIGWFTSIHPCRMRLPTELGSQRALIEALADIKDALRSVPVNGIGFGLLKYLTSEPAATNALSQWSGADLSVNFLGNFDLTTGDWRLESDSPGTTVSLANRPAHVLDVTAFRGDNDFTIALVADGTRVGRDLADAFLDRMQAVLGSIAALGAGPCTRRITASDHKLSGLDRQTLSHVLDCQDGPSCKVLRLTPAEEGMLFEALRRPESNAYTIQIHWRHCGELDPLRLQAAFEAVVARHDALRSRFVARDVPHPVRVVEPHATIAWRILDWRDIDASQQNDARTRLLDADRRRAFDLTVTGDFRAVAVRCADADWEILWTIHHIYFDGWSISILLTEIADVYESLGTGKPVALPPPPPFERFLEHLASTPEAPSTAFWSGQLSSFSNPTDLPFRISGSRLTVPGPDGASVRIRVPIPESLVSDIEALSARHAITQSTVFQFAWAFLLARCARNEDVVLGTTVSGRTAPVRGIEHMVGLAISTVPVRLMFDEQASSVAMIRKLHAALSAIEEHSHVPLTHLQRLSSIPGGERLFHSLFVFENYPWHRLAAGGQLRFEDLELLDKTEMPLTILAILKDQPRFEVAFDPTIFSTDGVETLCQHILAVLEAVAKDPDRRIADLEVTTPAERELLAAWNATERDIDFDRTVVEHVLDAVAAYPDRIAVKHGAGTLTYRELDAASMRLASRIRDRYAMLNDTKMPPETVVALMLERGPDMIVAMLAVMRAGGAYLPIDPDEPAERIGFMIEDARVALIIADPATSSRRGLEGSFRDRLIVTSDDADAAHDAALPRIVGGQLAYVMYTSGSTGRPKGTLVEHRGIVNRLAWVQGTHYALTPDDRVLQKTPYTFDVSIWELFWPLVHGATLVFADPGGHRDPAYLHRVIAENAVTVVHFVPSMLQVFVEHPGLEKLHTLRLMAASGEGLPTRLSARVLSALPKIMMVNLYGPTEATIEVSGHVCSLDDRNGGPGTPIGLPAWNTHLHCLDQAGRPVPVGVAGELHIGGVQLARGYLNRPDLTADRFVENAFGLGRLYKTGDLARHRRDGAIEYLGRIDFQMKIRGMRVEPGEIEAALEACAGIGQACVVADAEDGNGQLVAYVTAHSAIAEGELRMRLSESLPAHMVPARIVRLAAFPLTTSGKVDRRRLPQPGTAAYVPVAEKPAGERMTPTEALVAKVYGDVLRAGAAVDLDRSFFALGGHSLTAMRAAMRLSQGLEFEVPVRLVFEHATARAMAASLDRIGAQGQGARPLTRADRPHRMEPSFAQARVLFLESFAAVQGLYLVPAAMRIQGAFDEAAFARAAESLLGSHELLRTRYAFVDGAPWMMVSPDATPDLRVVDVSAKALNAQLHIEAHTGIALDREAPIRFRIWRLGAAERVLVVMLHHVVIDGWSLELLLTDLSRRYNEARRNAASSRPAEQREGLNYIDFVSWQRSPASERQTEGHARYWRDRMKDAPVLQLPTDHVRPAIASYRGSTASFVLSRPETDALEQFCRKAGSTLFPMLLAAWTLVLSRYSGQDDLVIGSPAASRPIPELEQMIGLFQNTIPLRVKLREDEAVISFVGRLVREIADDMAHQDLPFQHMIEVLGVARDPSRTPLFQAMLILDGSDTTRAVFAPDDAITTNFPLGSDTAKVDLTAAFTLTGDGLVGTLEYATELFSADRIERLGGHVVSVLHAFASDPLQRVGDVDILTPAERTDLLGRFNATNQPVDLSGTVLDAIGQQVALRPDAIAVAHGAEQMTYRGLDEASTRLASLIRARYREIAGANMPSEAVVALVLDRGVSMIVAILSAMKAGGTYLPISPDESAERVAFMIDDAAAVLIISHSAVSDRPALAACPEASTGARLILADEMREQTCDETLPRVMARQLAYVIYTSGSTGKPKGTLVEHRSLVNRMAWVQANWSLSQDDRVLQKTPYTFDVSISELIWPLVAGARLVFADPGSHRDPATLHRLIRQEGITVVHFVPSMLQAFVEYPGLELLTSIRLFALIGEALSSRLASHVLSALPGAALVNFYGPTEATIDVSAHSCSREDEQDGPVVAIGRPGWNTTFHVLDASRRLVPIGVPGELAIGGAQLARGYLDRPDLTEDRFIENPFGPSRLYRTGDLVLRDPDGEIHYLGRMDFQVKIRGMRVEPGEVEAALEACAGINRACVVARELSGETALVGYVTGSQAFDEAGLASRLATELAEHMRPVRIIGVETFPLTTSGKIDRGKLPDPNAVRRPAAAPLQAGSAMEQMLTAIWQDVLGHPDFSCADGFFDVGGTSLGAMRVVSAIAARLARTVPVVAVFRHPTIRDLAVHLDETGAAAPMSAGLDEARVRAAARRGVRAARRS